jgi:hypothetical protein
MQSVQNLDFTSGISSFLAGAKPAAPAGPSEAKKRR